MHNNYPEEFYEDLVVENYENLTENELELFDVVEHEKDYEEIVRILNKGCINLNKKNEDGMTPLHIAVKKDMVDIVELFLEKGVNPNIVNNDSVSPLETAFLEICLDCADLLINYYYTNINYRDSIGFSALTLAITSKCIDIIALLLQKGACIEDEEFKAVNEIEDEDIKNEIIMLLHEEIARRTEIEMKDLNESTKDLIPQSKGGLTLFV